MTPPEPGAASETRLLFRAMYASIAAAVITMALKAIAAAITGSVGLLSDALESVVNLVAAIVALVALRVAARPPDVGHDFGHGKAEYLSAAVEGAMVLIAAGLIVWTAVQRLVDPVPLDDAGLGLAVSAVASLINLGVGLRLVRTGRRHRSIAVQADGQHLLTDVWTSAGVLAGVALVAVFDWEVLDPIVAFAVGANIVRIGAQLLKRSVTGLLDGALPPDEVAALEAVLERCRLDPDVDFGPIRTRESGRQRFVYITVTVPPEWTVQRSHELTERLEREVAAALPGAITFVHVEPTATEAAGPTEDDSDDNRPS